MTSATSPSGIVTRSGVYTSSREAWRAFEDSASQSTWLSATWQAPAWIAYQWASGRRTVTRYRIKFTNGTLTSRAPRDWTLQGWTGSAWTVVDTRSNQTNWAGTETREYAVKSPGPYSKYRLHITKDNDSRSDIVVVSIARLELLGPPCGCNLSQVPAMTSSNSPSGTVTRSGVYSNAYEGWRAFDNGSSTSSWISAVWQAPAWIAYEWPDRARTITRYSIKFTNGTLTGRAPRDWRLQGWTGSTWVTVDTRTGQTNWAGTETRSFNVSNPGAYRKYRLHVTQDNDSRSAIVVVSINDLKLYEEACVAPGPICGDNLCNGGETSASCPRDCGSSTLCGNGICEIGESTTSCPADCCGAIQQGANPSRIDPCIQ